MNNRLILQMKNRWILLLSLLLWGYGRAAAQAIRSYEQGVVYVKMKDDLGYKVSERQLVLPGQDQKSEALLRRLAETGWWGREYEVSDEQLQQWRLVANKNLNTSLPDPRSAFRFYLNAAGRLPEAMALLQQLPGAEEVLRIPVLQRPPVPDFLAQQVYRGATAPGINSDSVWSVYNIRGAGIKLCDVEYGFNKTQSDFPPVTILGEEPLDPFADGGGTSHGTGVLGVLIAKDNGWGITGIAPDCQPYFAAAYTATGGYNLNTAMTNAMTALGGGDVMLLEQQIGGPNEDTLDPTTQVGLVPVEWFKPYYNTIRLAVGQGITVVEAAGNGQQNLDDAVYSTGNGGHHPFLPANNSGAIIVGAGGVGAGNGGQEPARARLWFSNYGSRVDLQGNGEAVVSTGYGDLYNMEGADNFYTAHFGGTSSASPIVSGAVILLQSAYKDRKGGAVLAPAQVRSLLKATGKPQTNGQYAAATHPVGPLPDVYKAVKEALTNVTAISPVAVPSSFTLYPNPSAGVFTLNFDHSNVAATVQVCNSAGTLVRELPGNSKMIRLDLSDQPAGMYWLRIVNGAEAVVKKIIIAR